MRSARKSPMSKTGMRDCEIIQVCSRVVPSLPDTFTHAWEAGGNAMDWTHPCDLIRVAHRLPWLYRDGVVSATWRATSGGYDCRPNHRPESLPFVQRRSRWIPEPLRCLWCAICRRSPANRQRCRGGSLAIDADRKLPCVIDASPKCQIKQTQLRSMCSTSTRDNQRHFARTAPARPYPEHV